MQEFILSRTGQPPAKITGTQIGIARSSNAAPVSGEIPPGGRQAFWIVLWAGSQLGREEPVDDVVVGLNAADLMAKLTALDGAEFVTGWPEYGEPAANRGRDFRPQHESVMRHGRKQLAEAVADAGKIHPAPVEIV